MSGAASAPAPADEPGRIVTFYSYKGGTGRSMALANVAWLLACNGFKVLVIDWDLEAPGLHRYFHPFIEDKDLQSTPGIIDYLIDLDLAARRAYADKPGPDAPRWFEPYTTLLRYSRSLDFEFPGEGTIDFVCAGQQDPAYSERVTSFDWRGFYEKLGGGVVLEALKQQLRVDYHFVLIDSRTGISDTSGICTVQMPDELVVLFTLNLQSIRGASAAAQSAFDQRQRPDGRPGLRIHPVRTRVERVEALRLRAAKDMAAQAFDRLLWHIPPDERPAYWGRVEVPHQPFYAHEEVLAAFGDGEPESGSMLAAMQVLAGLLAGERGTQKASLGEVRRKEVLGRFLPGLAALPPAVPAPPAARPAAPAAGVERWHVVEVPAAIADAPRANEAWVYVSYARADADPYLLRFVGDVTEQLRLLLGQSPMIFFDRRTPIERGEDLTEEIEHAIARCRVGLCLLSPAYMSSNACQTEFAMLSGRIMQGPGSGLVPVEWLPSSTKLVQQGEAARFQIFKPFPDGLRRLALRRRSEEYLRAVRELGATIAEVGMQNPLAPVSVESARAMAAVARSRNFAAGPT